VLYGRRQASHYGFPHKEVANVEFHHFGQCRDRTGGHIVEPMAGMDFETKFMGELGAGPDTIEFSRCPVTLPFRKSVAPRAGMDFDNRRTQGGSRFDLGRFRRNEQRHPNASSPQFSDQRTQRAALASGIESALGCAFLAPLRNNTRGMGSNLHGDVHHLAGRRHFKIKGPVDARLKPRDIVVADMTAILTEMGGNTVGTGRDSNFSGVNRVRMAAAARIAHRGDMVDVDAKTQL